MSIEARPGPSDRAIFLAALKIADAQARDEFLERACGGDAARRGQVERLSNAGATAAANPLDRAVEHLGLQETCGDDRDASLDFDSSTHTTIDRYKLLEQIGEGGMGTVFMARRLSLSLRRELDWIVMRALEKDRRRRGPCSAIKPTF